MPGPQKKFPEQTAVRLQAGTLGRVRCVLDREGDGADVAGFIRTAVERELIARESGACEDSATEDGK